MTSHRDSFLDRVVFIALMGRVIALDRDTGETVWAWKAAKGSDQPVVLLDDDRLVVSVHGYTYCLDPVTGEQRWANELKGMGIGDPVLLTIRRDEVGRRVMTTATKQMQHAASSSGSGSAASSS